MSAHRSDANAGRSQRQLRMGELIRKALAEILTQDVIDDARLFGRVITVSEARISPDLKNATAFVLPLGGDNQEEIVDALEDNKKFIRGQVSRLVRAKHTPQLNFELDTSFDNFSKIEDVLRSPHVARDLAPDDRDAD